MSRRKSTEINIEEKEDLLSADIVSMSFSDLDKFPFAKKIEAIEILLGKMDTEEISLEQMLLCHENGMKLVESCEKILSQAKQRVIKLDPSEK